MKRCFVIRCSFLAGTSVDQAKTFAEKALTEKEKTTNWKSFPFCFVIDILAIEFKYLFFL